LKFFLKNLFKLWFANGLNLFQSFFLKSLDKFKESLIFETANRVRISQDIKARNIPRRKACFDVRYVKLKKVFVDNSVEFCI